MPAACVRRSEGRFAVSERSPIDRLLDDVNWHQCESAGPAAGDGVPQATHVGFLFIAGCRLKCYKLSSGQRVFDVDSIERFFAGLRDELEQPHPKVPHAQPTRRVTSTPND